MCPLSEQVLVLCTKSSCFSESIFNFPIINYVNLTSAMISYVLLACTHSNSCTHTSYLKESVSLPLLLSHTHTAVCCICPILSLIIYPLRSHILDTFNISCHFLSTPPGEKQPIKFGNQQSILENKKQTNKKKHYKGKE